MSVTASVRKAGEIAIVDLSGRILQDDGAGVVRATVIELLSAGHRNILLNLREVSYIDSTGLGELVSVYATVTHAGGSVKLLHPQAKVHDLLQVTKMYTVFVAFDDENEALRSFAGVAASNRLFL